MSPALLAVLNSGMNGSELCVLAATRAGKCQEKQVSLLPAWKSIWEKWHNSRFNLILVLLKEKLMVSYE